MLDAEHEAQAVWPALESAGYQVEWLQATSAPELLDALDQRRWDVLVCAERLVRLSAFDVLALLHESAVDLPVLVLSDSGGEENAVAVMRAGARDFMRKSDLSRLVPAVARELRSAAVQRVQQPSADEMRYVLGHAQCLLWSGVVVDRLDPSGLMNWQTQVFDEQAAQRFAPIECLPNERFTSAWYRHRFDADKLRTNAVSTHALRSGSSSYTEVFGCHMRNGSIRWFSERVHIARLTAASWRVVGVAVDITERQQAQQALRDETMRVTALNQIGLRISAELDLQRLAQEVIAAAVSVTNALAGVFVYASIDDRGAYATNYAHAGTPAFEQCMANQPALFAALLHTPQVVRIDAAELPVIECGDLPFRSLLAVPVVAHRDTPAGTLLLGHDQMNAFDERAEQLALGLAAQATIALDNAYHYRAAQEAIRIREAFLSVAAHELRTPLTTMLGYAQFMNDRVVHTDTASEQERRALAAILHQGQRLNQLVASLLDRAQLQGGKLQIERLPVSLSAMVKRVVDDLLPTLRRHTIRLICSSDIRVLGDEARLEQVVYNLAANAIKYSPDGGEIAIEVARMANEALIAVRDQGIGIPASEQPHLFTQFYRASNIDPRRISGLGIGLFLVSEIVARHDGRVEVTSEQDYGSTFTVYLPLCE